MGGAAGVQGGACRRRRAATDRAPGVAVAGRRRAVLGVLAAGRRADRRRAATGTGTVMTGLTYAEVGATREEALPAGYRHVRRHNPLGTGPGAYLRAVD